ncbi:hypothetical protein VSS37_08290 [Candidatus Thiothrix sp. Deng01]|uniref:Fungal lipase-like domain-containing protein n=1 Tax=Candidatus Thiothrix phosphatis TaxID=3112415 RepID=A0ABU6CWQ1_9GAMM|nr:hypothetical protein [Candidatus Thiothrix sp. Deng01]MEB4590972.1 hypothetical protein [Candidatus Thiothrix sp. Deng01]
MKKDITPMIAWEALDYAQLSKAIYSSEKSIGQWVLVDESKGDEYCFKVGPSKVNTYGTLLSYNKNNLGVNDEVCLSVNLNGFHAGAYKNDVKKQIVIVFQGTDMLSAKDWLTNYKAIFGENLIPKLPFKPLVWTTHWNNGKPQIYTNMIGKDIIIPKQYKEALEFFDEIFNKYSKNGYTFILSGHSLGGGLAKYVSLARGKDAYTFNAAGTWLFTAGSAIFNRVESEFANVENTKVINIVGYYNGVEDPVSAFGAVPDSIQYKTIVSEYHTMNGMLSSLNLLVSNNYSLAKYYIDACSFTFNTIDLSKINPSLSSTINLFGKPIGNPYSCFYDQADDAMCQLTDGQFVSGVAIKKDGSGGLKYRWNDNQWYKSNINIKDICSSWFWYWQYDPRAKVIK